MDWQSIGVGGAALLTAVSALVGGVYTGRNQSRKDRIDNRKLFQDAEYARERAAEVASTARIEQIAADAADMRKRLRETEADFDARYRELRKHDQQGWDLARFYFGHVSTLMHLLNNLFTLITLEATPERVINSVKKAQIRVNDLNIPVHLEDPIIKDAV